MASIGEQATGCEPPPDVMCEHPWIPTAFVGDTVLLFIKVIHGMGVGSLDLLSIYYCHVLLD